MQNQAPYPQGQGQGQGHGQPLPPQPAPQVIYIQTAPPTSNVYENYAARTSRILGISRIVIGALSIVLQIIMIVKELSSYAYIMSYVGTGIWCGVMFILAGSFGVGAAATKTMCMIVSNMVLAIVSVTIFGTTYVALSSIGVSALAYRNNSYYYDRVDALLALYCMTLILALAQVVCDIWSAVICCKAVCCGRPAASMVQTHSTAPPNTQIVYAHGQVYPNQQQPGQVYLNQQQQQGHVHTNQQQQQGVTVAYNPQAAYQYQAPAAVPTTCGNPSPPPAYTQEEPKQQPQGFAA